MDKKIPEKIDVDNEETFYAIGLTVKKLNEIIDYLEGGKGGQIPNA